ncbi:MAG: thioredoxin-disulfide reductase [Elusimicrobia bacterium]|nr:thioredoxin-disulfide reductase [Elusimicrobiota bacterium]
MKLDALIIGAGPAGCTAAIYLARAGYSTLLLGSTPPGGQLLHTNEIENFPGFPEPLSGAELMMQMHKQCAGLKVPLSAEKAASVDLSANPFKTTASDGTVYESRTLIVATGATARWLNIESENRLRNKGVSACATCDGFFYRGKTVCVIGGGDSALGDAMFLSRFAASVKLIHRRDKLRACAALTAKAQSNPKISFVWDSTVEEILGGETVSGLRLKNVKTGQVSDLACNGVFLAIGHDPASELFDGKLDLDKEGYISVHDHTHTSVPGVFACGDVADPRYKQAVCAAGSGCMAALDARDYLNRL